MDPNTQLQTRILTLSAAFEDGDKAYTFMVHRRLAANLKKGDHVVVDTTAGLRVAKVVSVHDKDKRVHGKGIKWKWAFQKADTDRLEDLKTLETLID